MASPFLSHFSAMLPPRQKRNALSFEVVSYQELGVLASARELSPRTILVRSYALYGFAHVGGMGIAVGGFGALAPSGREDLAALAFRALAAAALATLLTGALAGVFFHGQAGIL